MILEIVLIIVAVFIFFSLLSVGWSISTYNNFVGLKQDISTQWSNIKTEYQRRLDLFYNLTQSVKSYKTHEKSTFNEVIKMRSLGLSGPNKVSEMKKLKGLDNLFARLLAVAENYPILKAGEQHNKLMDEIRFTEDRVNVARTSYNDIVRSYNTQVKVFPSNLIAGIFKFKMEIYYEAEEEASNKSPKINLE